MSFNPPASVLTHGGDTDSGISATVGHYAEHQHIQHAAVELAASKPSAIPERHMDVQHLTELVAAVKDTRYPHHMYSVNTIPDTIMREFKVVNSEAEHAAALDSGEWLDERPATVVVEDEPEVKEKE